MVNHVWHLAKGRGWYGVQHMVSGIGRSWLGCTMYGNGHRAELVMEDSVWYLA